LIILRKNNGSREPELESERLPCRGAEMCGAKVDSVGGGEVRGAYIFVPVFRLLRSESNTIPNVEDRGGVVQWCLDVSCAILLSGRWVCPRSGVRARC